MKYCFGVDIGGTTVKIGLFSTEGELFEKWEIKTRTENGGEAILPDVAQAILSKMKDKGIERKHVEGVGVGIPAPVNAEGIVKNTANLGWGYKEVKRELMELLPGMKVEAANDANVAALGEMWLGAGKGQKNMIMVTLGTGVGGGVIIDGKVLTGEHGAGGEIGHICVNRQEKEACGCGLKGCLEQYASATGIVRLARRWIEAHEEEYTMLREKPLSAKSVFDAMRNGDEAAGRVIIEFGNYLGYALANLAVVTDPAVIVIGGGVSKAGEILLGFIKEPFYEKAFFANKEVEFALATLGNDAGICGAARLII